jgi:hypothetical protein
MFKQVSHPLLLPLGLSRLRSLLFLGTTARLFGDLDGQFLADDRQGMQDRLGYLLDDVELTDLVADIRKHSERR